MSQLFGMSQLVTEPTRVTMTSSSLIDVIMTTSPECHTYTGVMKLTLSDHFMPFTIIDGSTSKSPSRFVTIRDYKRFNVNAFLEEIRKEFAIFQTYLSHSCNLDINDIWTNWKVTLEKVSSRHAPLKTKSRNNPWMTKEIIASMYDRDRLHNLATKHKDENTWKLYKNKRNNVVHMINEAQKLYYENAVNLSENKNREMWKSLRHMLNINTSRANVPNLNADKFNTFFANVGKQLADKIPKCQYEWHLPDSIYNFETQQVEVSYVYKLLRLLKDRSNLDVINMDSKLLHIAAEELSPTLTAIINLSISTGYLPEDWKLAKVTPVYKNKGAKNDCGSYRPISVICHIAKIMEKAVQTQLKNYLLEHDFITNIQSAYLANHSTQSSLHNVVCDILDGINDNNITGLCCLDLQKCFDTIDHSILLTKLEKYGIRGITLNWLKNYLSGRQQRATLNNEFEVMYGVPQGSILGPILFLIFINDLPTCLAKCQCNLFADDTVLYTNASDVDNIVNDLQSDVNNIADWFSYNRPSVNISKSCSMLIGTRNCDDPFEIVLNGGRLNTVTETPYLGVTLSTNLSWEKHISNICKKVGYGVSILYRLSHKVNYNELVKVYKTIIQPHIDYCITIWGYSPNNHIHKVQRLQNRIARLLTRNYDYNVSPSTFVRF